ncbi:MAG: hypothetical protein ACI4I8_07770 [Oscillospiraceae bacterium]
MNPFFFFLRIAALLDSLLLSYPILAVLEVAITGQLTSASSLPRLGIVLAAGALGALTGWLLDRMKHPPVRIVTLLLAASPAAFFAGGCLCILGTSLFHWALVILSLVIYAVGMFFATHSFDELIGTSFLSFTMIAYFLAAIIVWFCGSYLGMICEPILLIVSFLLFILLYAIISNQSNIERLMGRRHYDLSMLPAGMRRYNLLLICGGFVLVTLGLLFQKPIWHIIKFLLRVLSSFLYVFVLFFRFITWLLARPTQPDKPLPQVSSLPVFGEAQEAASTSFLNVLFQWLALFLILLFLFFLRRQIWDVTKKAAAAVWKLIKALFSRTGNKQKSAAAFSEYYVDMVEDLERDTVEASADKEEIPTFRIWQRQCRDFLEAPPKNRSLRDGYLLILTWLRIHGAPLSPADTTLEILNKSLTRMPESPFSHVTERFNDTYYGELPLLDDDYESLVRTLRILMQEK